jgi:hypothetical protein
LIWNERDCLQRGGPAFSYQRSGGEWEESGNCLAARETIAAATTPGLRMGTGKDSFHDWTGNFRSAQGFWSIPEALPLFRGRP